MNIKRTPIVGTFLTGPIHGPWGIHLSDRAWQAMGKKVRRHSEHRAPRAILTTFEEAITRCTRFGVQTTLAGAFNLR